MKVIERAFQGELAIQRVDAIPEGVKPATPDGRHWVVGHSETGHHHVVDVQAGQLFEDPQSELVCYLRLDQPGVLEHLRSHDTHEALELPAGNWEIHRQREWTPEGERRAID